MMIVRSITIRVVVSLWFVTVVVVVVATNNNNNHPIDTDTMIHQITTTLRTWQQSHDRQQQQQHSSWTTILRPFVTGTFAQSIDGYLSPWSSTTHHTEGSSTATIPMSNYPLSGPESSLLTHALRSMHDGILIGGRTLLLDNPRLTNRRWWGMASMSSKTATTSTLTIHHDDVSSDTEHVPVLSSSIHTKHHHHHQQQPQPIIIDPHLRYLQQFLSMEGTIVNVAHPIVCCTFQAASSHELHLYHYFQDTANLHLYRNNLTNQTIRLLPCQCERKTSSSDDADADAISLPSLLNMTQVLHQLYQNYNIRTIMVEGGASTLSTLFPVMDALIVTIAPQWFGHGIRPPSHSFLRWTPSLKTNFVILGNDAIFVARCNSTPSKQCTYGSERP